MSQPNTVAHLSYGMDLQQQIYLKGMLQGERPGTPLSYAQLEAAARERMTPEGYGYVAGGAGSEATMRANLAAFDRYPILPRMLRNVADRDLRVRFLGQEYAAPIFLAPIGVQSLAHPDAELATARAAASIGIPFILSTASSHTIEAVAAAAGDGPRWYQLYWGRDPEINASFLARAEAAGYSALVVTLDTKLLSWRERDLQNAFLPFLRGEGIANYLSDPVFRAALPAPPEENPQAAIMHFLSIFSDHAATWDDLAFIRTHTRLPILLKGILHPDDARLALDYGMDGVIVSNHGGRQVDGSIAALDALPGVVAAVGGRAPVLFDSGIRRGADAFKAIALGAQAVLLGRPFVWGLALSGEAGVREVVQYLLADLELTMALSGHATFATVNRTAVG